MTLRSNHPAHLRYAIVTTNELDKLIAEAKNTIKELESTIKQVKQLKVSKLQIDGATKAERGIRLLGEYQTHVKKALNTKKQLQEV